MARAVLFVDDSPLARAAAARALASSGITLISLSSAREALAVDVSGIHAALLDIELGDGLGADVAAALRRAAPELPIAFLTAGAEGEVIAAARAIGPVFSKGSEADAAFAWVIETIGLTAR